MKRPRASCSISSCRRAFTLVEVVASLMLLGTLLVGMLSAHRRHAHQIRTAKARLEAIAVADKLLSQWREQGTWSPATTSGRIPDRSDFVWRWSVASAPELSRVGASVGRLEIFSTAQTDQSPLARVELVTTEGGPIQTDTRHASP